MLIVADIVIIEVQEEHIREIIFERHSIIESHLGIFIYLLFSVNLIKQGLFNSELINWLVANI